MLGLQRNPRARRSIPYRMFDREWYGLEAKNASVLERVYHKGHASAWDGKQVLAALLDQYGPPNLPPEKKKALGRVFAIIMWGELAAWRISAELADEIEPLEAKMAATSQAFDEARHFYVIHDYLVALDALPDELDWGARTLLEAVMNADHLAKKLLGMQLMVEPVALTLFHIVKKLELEPVLTHLLPYFERDESRHVALGVQYLPAMVSKMSLSERLELVTFQIKLLTCELISNYRISRDMAELGVDPRLLLDVGKAKQFKALEHVFSEHGQLGELPIIIMGRYADFVSELTMPRMGADGSVRARVSRAWSVLVEGTPLADIELLPTIADSEVPFIPREENERVAPRAVA